MCADMGCHGRLDNRRFPCVRLGTPLHQGYKFDAPQVWSSVDAASGFERPSRKPLPFAACAMCGSSLSSTTSTVKATTRSAHPGKSGNRRLNEEIYGRNETSRTSAPVSSSGSLDGPFGV